MVIEKRREGGVRPKVLNETSKIVLKKAMYKRGNPTR